MSDICPNCHEDLSYEHNGIEYSHLIGVEIQGVYDGVLFWQCPRCDHRWHRFPEDHYLHQRARKYVEWGKDALAEGGLQA